MKIIALLLLITLSFNGGLTAYGQGSLTPPGPPAATMRTLAQVESRTPIASAPYVISAPGAYYLAANLIVDGGNAITIATNQVSLDLMGFTIRSTAPVASGYGIKLASGVSDIQIINGHIRGSVTNNSNGVYSGGGFRHGVSFTNEEPRRVAVKKVTVSGVQADGINIGFSSSAEFCLVDRAGGQGITAATVNNSAATECGLAAITATTASGAMGTSFESHGIWSHNLSNSSGFSTNHTGIYGGVIENCYGTSGGALPGIESFSSVDGCYGTSAQGSGIVTINAMNSRGEGGGLYGLQAKTAQNCSGLGGHTGLQCARTATGCSGQGNSIGLSAFIADTCTGFSTGTSLSVTHTINSF